MRRISVTLALVVLLASCTEGAGEGAETPDTTGTTQAVTDTTDSAEGNGRPLRVVGCEPAHPDVEIVCETIDLVHRHYVDEITDDTLARAAIQGLETLDGATAESELVCAAPAAAFQETCEIALEQADTSAEAAEAMVFGLAAYGLDPNSVYFDPDALELVEEEQSGEIQGIGALVSAEDSSTEELCNIITDTCRMYIISTIEDTPAEAAGLQPDDVVVAVNGESIIDWTVDEVTATVRGPAGTDVGLTIERGEGVFEVTITRAAFEVPVIRSEVVGDAGYVSLNTFTDNADELFEEAVRDLLDQDVDSLVFDLRNNPGGLLDTAIEVASVFLPDGDVVVTESPDSSTSYPVSGNPIVPAGMKVVVLVNEASASASEVVSAVLQERDRVTLVGENTFGKNTVQQRFALSNGGALKLTIARWLTPGGLDFGSIGVTPDVVRDIETGLPVEDVVQEALAASVTVAG
ncbi:MAG: S41 family peptidase [Acidimicrobiia bacterium]